MKKLYTFLLIFIISSVLMPYAIVRGFQRTPVTLYVYEDGSVLVNQIIHIDNPPKEISVSLLGEPFFIEARAGSTVIPVNVSNSVAYLIAPDTEVELSYITISLTSKAEEEWVLSYSSSYNTSVILPENSMPYNITPSNFDIEIVNNSVALAMPPGKVVIRYVLTPQIPEAAPSNPPPNIGSKYILYIVSFSAIFAVLAVIYIVYRKRKKGEKYIYKDLDERDNKILNILSKYGELTAKDIMEKTSIPKTPLYRRLKRLMDSGLVETVSTGGVLRYRIKMKK